MGIEKIADGIEQAKLGYMEAVCGAAERAKAEIKAANGDRSRSGSWAREVILGVVKAYEAERAKMAGEVMPKLKGLYSEGLEAAADVLSKQPTAGEAAYLQAFMMKQRITESDVEQAKIALRGSAVGKPSGRLSAERRRHGGVIPRWQAPPCGIASVPDDSNRASEGRRRGPLAGDSLREQ